MDARSRTAYNRNNGAGWEDIFSIQAQNQGFFVRKVGLSARFIGAKKVIATRSFLDFQVARPTDGRVAFIDTKTFAGDRFTYSDIDPEQLRKAIGYNAFKIPAGFLCLFRKTGDVGFFSGIRIAEIGPGNGFDISAGIHLGDIWKFDVSRIF